MYNFLKRIHKKWGVLAIFFSWLKCGYDRQSLSSHLGSWGRWQIGKVKEQQVKRTLDNVTLKPFSALWRVYLWTSVMRKRVLSCLSYYCFGLFFFLTHSQSESNYTQWDFIPHKGSQNVTPKTRLLCSPTELSWSTPLPAWFFFNLPFDTVSLL